MSTSQEERRLLVVYNPSKKGTSNFLDEWNKIRSAANELDLPLDELYNLPPNKIESAIANRSTKNTIVTAIGGDGTVHKALNGLMRAPEGKRGQLLIVPEGSADDGAKNRYGQRRLHGLKSVAGIIATGKTVEVHPLQVTVQDEITGKTSTRFGLNNFGIGYTGSFARLINSPTNRDMRGSRVPIAGSVYRDLRLLGVSLQKLPDISIEELNPETGEPEEKYTLTDLSIVHAARAAKRLKFDTSHTTDSFRVVINPTPTRRSILRSARRMWMGIENGIEKTHFAFRVGETAVAAHVDGEDFALEPGQRVDVRLAENSLHVFSKKDR